jgi:hypothetical protein
MPNFTQTLATITPISPMGKPKFRATIRTEVITSCSDKTLRKK